MVVFTTNDRSELRCVAALSENGAADVGSVDDSAKRIVMQLIEETGFCAVDCGRLENARTLDLMVPLMIELDQRFAGDALSSWKFIHGGA